MKHKMIFIIIGPVLLVLFGCNNNPVIPPPPVGPDTTSHNIIWQSDTLGDFMSDLSDIWGTSPDNVWAVGLIRQNVINGTSVLHYDGKKWEAANYFKTDLKGIYGFSETDIWAVGSDPIYPFRDALIAHYDGNSWSTKEIIPDTEPLNKIWGTSSNDLFAVGSKGIILHYNGSKWTKMQSGKSYSLQDVWGFAPNDVYAGGGGNAESYAVLLHYDGSSWKAIVDSSSQTKGQIIQTIWGSSPNNVYYWSSFGGSTSGFFNGSVNTGWNMQTIPNDHTVMQHMRGSSANNIFIVGPFSIILHYNGSTWHRYDEIYRKPGGDILSSVFTIDKTVFIVGQYFNTAKALIYKGTIK